MIVRKILFVCKYSTNITRKQEYQDENARECTELICLLSYGHLSSSLLSPQAHFVASKRSSDSSGTVFVTFWQLPLHCCNVFFAHCCQHFESFSPRRWGIPFYFLSKIFFLAQQPKPRHHILADVCTLVVNAALPAAPSFDGFDGPTASRSSAERAWWEITQHSAMPTLWKTRITLFFFRTNVWKLQKASHKCCMLHNALAAGSQKALLPQLWQNAKHNCTLLNKNDVIF